MLWGCAHRRGEPVPFGEPNPAGTDSSSAGALEGSPLDSTATPVGADRSAVIAVLDRADRGAEGPVSADPPLSAAEMAAEDSSAATVPGPLAMLDMDDPDRDPHLEEPSVDGSEHRADAGEGAASSTSDGDHAETDLGDLQIPEGVADSVGSASDTAPADTLFYGAKRLRFDADNDVLYLQREANLRLDDQKLAADSIRVETLRDLLVAVGEAVLEDPSDRVIGDRVVMDLSTERGYIENGITALEDGIYEGREIRRVGASFLDVEDGTFSTCRIGEPHYTFNSDKMRIEDDELVVMRPLVLEVAEVPVFYLPYFVFSLRRGRHSGILVPSLENDSQAGRFLRNFGYYWATNDYLDLMTRADLHRTGRIRSETVARFVLRDRIPLSSIRFIQDHQPGTGRESSDLSLAYSQSFSDGTKIRFNASGRRASSRSSSSFNLDRTLSARLNATRDFGDWGNASATMRTSRNLETGRVVEELPNITFSRSWSPFFPEEKGLEGPWPTVEDSLGSFDEPAWYRSLGWSYSASGSIERNLNAGAAVDHQALEHRFGISSRGLNFIDGVNVSPSLRFKESWFSLKRDPGNDNYLEGWTARHTWDASVSVSSSIQGIYRPGVGRVNGLLHVIEPRLSFFYTPEFDQYFEEVNGRSSDIFAGLGSSSTPSERRSISYSLANSLRAKWLDSEGDEELINLLSVNASGSYDAARDVRGDLDGEQHFSNLSVSGRLQPQSQVRMTFSMPYDPYERERGTMTATVDMSLREESEPPLIEEAGGAENLSGLTEREKLYRTDPYADLSSSPWNLSLRGTWSVPREAESSLRVTGSLGFQPTPKWRLDYRSGYNFSEREQESQYLSVRRDLHCWEGSFTWNEASGAFSYFIEIRLKALPDVKVEKRETGFRR